MDSREVQAVQMHTAITETMNTMQETAVCYLKIHNLLSAISNKVCAFAMTVLVPSLTWIVRPT